MRGGLVCWLAALLIAVPAGAEKKPEKMVLDRGSREALIMMRVPRLAIDYSVGISSFDPVLGQLPSGLLKGRADLAIGRWRPGQPAQDFVVRSIKPGTYVIRDASQQLFWGICFHAASLSFDIRAGQALFLGSFDGAAALESIREHVVARHELTTSGKLHYYFEDIPPVPLAPPNAESLAAAQTFAREKMTRVAVRIEAAQPRPAAFGTGHDLLGTQRQCGGFSNDTLGGEQPKPAN